MDEKDKLIAQLLEQIRRLEEVNKVLKEKIAQLEKNSNNSSKPPSSDIAKPDRTVRKKVKRKRGGQPGHKKKVRQPFKTEEVDQFIQYELIEKDAKGLIPLDEWQVFQQIDLPEKMYKVIEYRARKYLDPKTGATYITPLPDEVRRGGLLSAKMTAAIAFMKGNCHMSYSTIQQYIKEVMSLKLSRGMLCKAALKTSQALKEPYQQLADRLPDENYLGIDETGHKNGKQGRPWTWCFQTPEFGLFHIAMSRGSRVLIDMLGESFNGIIGCDYYGAYRCYSRLYDIRMQYCLAHLIREIRFLAEHINKRLVRWGKQLLEWLRKLFKTLHNCGNYTLTGYQKRIKTIKEGFLSRMRRPPDHREAKKLARRFKGRRLAEHYFRFLTEPGVEPTNNGTEREIRHTVIDRRVTQGTRGNAGMRWCERIWTTIATCKKQNRNVFEFIHNAIAAYWNNQLCPKLV